MENVRICALNPIYDRRKSFYGKAHYIFSGNDIYLKSYDTIVCGIVGGNFRRYWPGWSVTTARHVNEFRRQEGLTPVSKSEWFNIPYCEDRTW